MPVLERERFPGLHASMDGGQSLRRRRDPAYPAHVLDYRHSGQSSATPVNLQFVSRDWQEHHRGRNYGWIIGGILGLVIVCLVGAYAVVRWRRIRARKLSMTSRQSEVMPGKGSHASVDSAPLLNTAAEHWVPTLHRISEHIEEPSVSSTLCKGSTIGSVKPIRDAVVPDEDMRLDMYPLQERTSEQDPISLPGPSSYPLTGLGAHDRNKCEDESRPYQEEPSFPPHQPWVNPEDELETPNVSASDSDSMQVHIPWRNSTRFIPERTQSLQLENASQELSAPLARNPRHSSSQPQPSLFSLLPGNPRRSFSQPQPLPASPLHLRAVAEEQEHAQASSSRQITTSTGNRRQSLEDDVSMNESEGSETASTMSSLARLKLRLTGSAPFLPLIQEYSPLDTDSLWGRFRGDAPQSRPISLKSQSSRGMPWSNPKPSPSSNLHHSRPSSPPSHSPSRLSHSIIAPSSRPASPKSASPHSAPPSPASPKPGSSPPSSSSFPTSDHDRPISPESSSPVARPTTTFGVASSTMNVSPEIPAISSPISYPPWQSRLSALTASYDTNTSTSSLRDLSDFPSPPGNRSLPRPLPRRPLPHIPPPPSYLPPKPPVMIPDQERSAQGARTHSAIGYSNSRR